MITHIDRGFDFLGMRIQRHKKRGASKRFVYTYPTRASLASVKAKVKAATTRRTTNTSLAILIHQLNPVLRGWTNNHRYGASAKTFSYLGAHTWRRVWLWLRAKHSKATVRYLQRRYLNRWWPEQDGAVLFNPDTVAVTRYRYRYRYRGAAIPAPWATTEGSAA